jgi:hypothetical protein
MVNIQYWMECLSSSGHASKSESVKLLNAARRIFFADRTEQRLFAAFEKCIGSQRLKSILSATGGTITDIKLLDAERAVLYAKRAVAASGLVPLSHRSCDIDPSGNQ